MKKQLSKYYKLVKEYKGLKPLDYSFVLEGCYLVCHLPFSGKIIFPIIVLEEGNYFEAQKEEIECDVCELDIDKEASFKCKIQGEDYTTEYVICNDCFFSSLFPNAKG